MSLSIENPKRVFKIGSIRLDDPDPTLSPEEAVQLYAGSYPQVIDCSLNGPDTGQSGELVYEIERSPVKTKG